MKNTGRRYDDALAIIESMADYNDMFLREIALHGPNNVLNSNLSESANIKLQNIAKRKITELENLDTK